MRIEQLVQQPFSSLGTAITTFSGQNLGAKKIERVKQGYHRGILISFIFFVFIFVVFQLLSKYIVGFFVKDDEVIRIGSIGLRITSCFYFSLAMIYVPRSVLNGCGDTSFAMINGATEVVGRIVFANILTKITSITLFGHIISIGYWGIWLTTAITWTLTAIVCIIRYKSGVWFKKSVVLQK